SVYAEDDGTVWIDRTWQDPETGATWNTYENAGVAADDQRAAGLPVVHATPRFLALAQAQPQPQPQAGCHPLTSVVLLEGRVELQPKAAALTGVVLTPGQAGAVSDVAVADSALTPQALQAFDQATSNPRDVAAAQSAARLGSQVADEFANVIVPSATPGGPGG